MLNFDIDLRKTLWIHVNDNQNKAKNLQKNWLFLNEWKHKSYHF